MVILKLNKTPEVILIEFHNMISSVNLLIEL